jgi:hypothetical protein
MGKPSQASTARLIAQLTHQISRRRLAAPAILFFEMTKPLSFIASQGLLLCQPLLSFFYEGPLIAEYANLLADRANVEHLIRCLERDDSIRSDDGRGRG